jgi:hypothetical protein
MKEEQSNLGASLATVFHSQEKKTSIAGLLQQRKRLEKVA